MDLNNAKQILITSINQLAAHRSGQLTLGDVQAEVINNGCRYLLGEHRLYIDQVHDVSSIGSVLNLNFRYQAEAQLFTQAGMQLFPGQYNADMAASGELSILSNISWSGMWDFLREYFHQSHGEQIDDAKTLPVFFNSSRHRRYEHGLLVSESAEKRVVSLTFKDDSSEVLVSIAPSLSPKNAYRISEAGEKSIYKGFDPDYLFTIKLDAFDEVDEFILELPNRALKIIYHA